MRSSRRWLWGLLLAWAGAAAIVVAPGADILAVALCGCWLAFFASLLSRSARRRAIVSFIAFALPLQGIAGVSIQALGPAHFHSGFAQHSHRDVQHHHHSRGTEAVSVEQGRPFSALAVEENRRLDTASCVAALPDFRADTAALQSRATPGLPLHIPSPHEDPPRI